MRGRAITQLWVLALGLTAYPFMADLCRKLTCAHQVDMIRVSSYKGTVAGWVPANPNPSPGQRSEALPC